MTIEDTHTQFLKSIAYNTSSVLFRYQLSPTPGFDYINEAISFLTGYPLANFLENPGFLAQIIHLDDRDRFEHILSTPEDGAVVLRVIRRDGVIRSCDFHFVHVISIDRELVAVEGTIQRRLAEPGPPGDCMEEPVNERVLYYAEKLKTAGRIGMALAEKLSLADIYLLLSNSIAELFPDLRMITIALYHPDAQQLECVSAIIENEVQDASLFPRVPLEPPGKGTQSEAIHLRKPVVIPDLAVRQKKLSQVTLVASEGESDGTAPQSALCIPIISKDEVLGVVQMQSASLGRFTDEDAEMLLIVANTAAAAMQNAALVESLEKSRADVQSAYEATLEGFSRALEIRDQETEGHTRRVAELARNFGRRLQLDESTLTDLVRGAILHDVGKIGVPDAVLSKPGPLTVDEWVRMRMHAEYGYRILADVPFLQKALEVPHYHHEKWDGSGYPAGLKGEDIPFTARIFAIVDVWDALISDRPYRKAWSREKTREHILEGAGKHFEPRLVSEFINLIDAQAILG